MNTDKPWRMAYTAPKKGNPARICSDISNAIHQVSPTITTTPVNPDREIICKAE